MTYLHIAEDDLRVPCVKRGELFQSTHIGNYPGQCVTVGHIYERGHTNNKINLSLGTLTFSHVEMRIVPISLLLKLSYYEDYVLVQGEENIDPYELVTRTNIICESKLSYNTTLPQRICYLEQVAIGKTSFSIGGGIEKWSIYSFLCWYVNRFGKLRCAGSSLPKSANWSDKEFLE
jgi:hypothetical protein